jgi:ATP-dependent Clp protease protease subunit
MMHEEFSDPLRARLLEQRVVSIFGSLGTDSVSEAAARLWTLDALGDAPIRLLLSISSGSVDAAASLLDVLDVVGVEVHATCLGGISGPAVAVLAAASRRLAAPSARFVLRDEAVRLAGSFKELERAVRQHHEQRLALLGRIAESTGGRRSLGDVLADFERGISLSAEEARRYGLVDRVEAPRDRVVSLLRPSPAPPSVGFRPGPRP